MPAFLAHLAKLLIYPLVEKLFAFLGERFEQWRKNAQEKRELEEKKARDIKKGEKYKQAKDKDSARNHFDNLP